MLWISRGPFTEIGHLLTAKRRQWSAVGAIFRVCGRRIFGHQTHPISALWISLPNLSWSKKSALSSTSH
ncbi:hypothetical protein Y032_0035g3105 [Ancylostoma ceylanicum]|uniref:Uncharacterized protein n=1 Tax=Ancylostoma ceylanicum TaxID=53326 RepID=A0A016UNJ6_9BILA|nr:hypothetical protein Y032_0035g3105 [Ancylostoma ceylanicum]